MIPSVEEDINDDNITESIMEKMIAAGEENTPIKVSIDPTWLTCKLVLTLHGPHES